MHPLSLSVWRRLLMVGLAVVFCLLMAGVVFGYSALKPLLISSGVYANYCPRAGPVDDGGDPPASGCPEQVKRLDDMFTYAAAATNIAAIVIGFVLDVLGPRVAACCGSVLFLGGCAGMAGSFRYGVDLYYPSYTLLAVGGPFMFMSTLHLSSAFPTSSGLVMALLTGAFDASSIVFLVFAKLYAWSPSRFNLGALFMGFGLVPICALIYSVLLMPRTSFQRLSGPALLSADANCIDDDNMLMDGDIEESCPASELDGLLKDAGGDAVISITGNPLTDLKYKSALLQIRSWTYLFLLVFMCMFMLRLNFYIATVDSQLEEALNTTLTGIEIEHVVEWFQLLLPLGGAIAVLPIGWLLDAFSLHVTFLLLFVMGLAFGILSILPLLQTQITAILIFVVMRPLLYTAASEFGARVFGFKNFGKVYGSLTLVSGLFNFLQTIVSDVARQQSFKLVNLILTIVTSIMAAFFPLYITYFSQLFDYDDEEMEVYQQIAQRAATTQRQYLDDNEDDMSDDDGGLADIDQPSSSSAAHAPAATLPKRKKSRRRRNKSRQPQAFNPMRRQISFHADSLIDAAEREISALPG